MAAIVNALDGAIYVTDRAGVISGASRIGEIDAAHTHEAANGRPDYYVGFNIFDIIASEDVRNIYRKFHGQALKVGAKRIAFDCRCDGPDIERTIRNSIGPFSFGGRTLGVIYQSVVVAEPARPPLDLFLERRARGEAPDLPVVHACSFCHDVRRDAPDAPWRSPEAYYRDGGPSRAVLSHGVCPKCKGRMDKLAGL